MTSDQTIAILNQQLKKLTATVADLVLEMRKLREEVTDDEGPGGPEPR